MASQRRVVLLALYLALFSALYTTVQRADLRYRTGHPGQRAEHPDALVLPFAHPDIFSAAAAGDAPVNASRMAAVRDAVRHAWQGYWEHARGYDDLRPISRSGLDWLHAGATVPDSLDTLWIAGLEDEYNDALGDLVHAGLPESVFRTTKTFEYNIRVVGGLLGAFSLTGDPLLLDAARRTADSLLAPGAAFDTPTGLPHRYSYLALRSNWLGSACVRIAGWVRNRFFQSQTKHNSLVGVGTYAVEFGYLSSETGDARYVDAVDATAKFTVRPDRAEGLVPSVWNVYRGVSAGAMTVGSGGDSFYEYLLKYALLDKGRPRSAVQKRMLDKFKLVARAVQGQTVEISDVNFPVTMPVGNQYEHLLCYLPGLLALGTATGHLDGDGEFAARKLLQGCCATYAFKRFSACHLGPERLNILANPPAGSFGYFLRPETVESLYHLYVLTGDTQYQDFGWEIFQAIEKHCKVVSGGYAGIRDVRHPDKERVDEMPSYFLAETLKYLLLLFGPRDYLPVADFVFNTEAHPVRRSPLCRSHPGIDCRTPNRVLDAPPLVILVVVPFLILLVQLFP